MGNKTLQITRFIAEVMRAHRGAGLNMSEALVFEALDGAGGDGWRLTALATYLQQDKSSVRRWLDRMVRLGFVERRDGVCRITAAGTAERKARFERFLTSCPPRLQDALQHIADAGYFKPVARKLR